MMSRQQSWMAGVVSVACMTSAGMAATFHEEGDAGDFIGGIDFVQTITADRLTGSGELLAITGALESYPARDAVDAYRVYLHSPAAFVIQARFTAEVDDVWLNDPVLYLFDADGMPVLFNDNIGFQDDITAEQDFRSLITTPEHFEDYQPSTAADDGITETLGVYQPGLATAGLLPQGEYIIAISGAYQQALGENDAALFGSTLAAPNDLYGPVVNTPLTKWAFTNVADGPYEIRLSGFAPLAAIPEPASMMTLLAAMGLLTRRRR